MGGKVRKVPYYTMEPSVFRGTVWKEHLGIKGAVPINTLQKISFDRLAPGEKPPPPPPKPTAEQLKAQQAEAARQKLLAEQAKKQQPKEPPKPQPKVLEAEDQDKLPEFDLQDIPGAMDKIGWPIAAKIARRWFNGPAHIWDDDLDSVQPIDDTTITLAWALKFQGVKKRFDQLLELIYSKNAHAVLRKKILQHATEVFTKTSNADPTLGFDTTAFTTDLRKFHIDWHFQKKEVSILDTTEGVLSMTDISAALGNFVFYAAIGRVEVTGSRYYKYDTNPHQYCNDAVAKLTHVYVYLKDNYSFNDKDPSKSQYLGHWNKKDMVTSYYLAGNDIAGQLEPSLRRKNINDTETIETYHTKSDYLPNQQAVDKPIDTRRGMFGKLLEKDVYWPVYNRSYNEWRKKHNRGEDFMIYSKPQLHKLKNPIIIELGTICRPYDNTSKSQ